MTSIYISSTFNDLIKHREAVIRTLRKLNKVTVSMEDYTADDRRPLEKCLADVAKCDIYIGLFAFRYGFIPDHDNLDNLSITELEYQQARKGGKPCLIFMASEDDLPIKTTDLFSGENDRGEKITRFREQLAPTHARMVFRSPDDLSVLVSTAVVNLIERVRPGATSPTVEKAIATPLPREVTFDLFLAYSDVDAAFAEDLANYLQSHRLRTLLDPRAQFASTVDDFLRLERSVRCVVGSYERASSLPLWGYLAF